MNYILFDDSNRENLLPLTFTRPIAEIRVGILTIKEKWEHYLNCKVSFLAEEYLSDKFPMAKAKENILIAGSICPNPDLVEAIIRLKPGQTLISEDTMIASYVSEDELNGVENLEEATQMEIVAKMPFNRINYTYDIFSLNDVELRADYELLTKGRKSAPISSSNIIIGDDIFVEEGAVVEASTLNSKTGPIYIGKDSEIMEGAHIRGPFALCNNAIVKMSAKIYGATTVGPYSKVAGELSNVVFLGYSNKAHDGFFGSSVIGEWCNIGADSNTSNLKNTYDDVRLWNYQLQTFISTGLQFCGTIMGDHVKCGINTMFNTGTIVGCAANVFGSGFQRNFIASFSWGGPSGMSTYKIDKAINVAERIFQRRNLKFTEFDKQILNSIYELTHTNRKLRF